MRGAERPSRARAQAQEALEKLEADGGANPNSPAALKEATVKARRKLREMEEAEHTAWRKHFLELALGPEPTSCMGMLLASHKLAYQRAVERHNKQRLTLADLPYRS